MPIMMNGFVKPMRVAALVLFLASGAIVFQGCATKALMNARTDFYRGDIPSAVTVLSDEDKVPNRDKLLLYMEKGVALHEAGNYKESIATLLKATALMDEQDIISLTGQAVSLMTTERTAEYKGEYSERLWVHTYLMMNFLLTGQYESALVEAKQALKIFESHPDPLRKDYFTRALIALSFEMVGELNGAYIEYKKLAEDIPEISFIVPELYRLAMKLGFSDDASKYEKKIPEADRERLKKPFPSEVVVFIGTGRIPEKKPGDIVIPPAHRFSFPYYPDVRSESLYFEPFGPFRNLPVVTVHTNMGAVAKASLDDRRTAVILKETARVAAREIIAKKVEDDAGAAAGILLRLAFFVMAEADIRCWQTLPENLVLVRVPLPEGDQTLTINVSGARSGMGQTVTVPRVKLAKGKRAFFSIRLDEMFLPLSPPLVKTATPP